MHESLFRKAEDQILSGSLADGLVSLGYMYEILHDTEVPAWARLERTGYPVTDPATLPDYRRESLEYFDIHYLYQWPGYTPSTGSAPLPPRRVPESSRERTWHEPIEAIQARRSTASQEKNAEAWDARFLIPHAVDYLKDHPVYGPDVQTQVQMVVAHSDPSWPAVIVENVRTRALALLTSLRPLLHEPEADVEKWSVAVQGDHNVVLVRSDVEGGVHQQVSIPEIERVLRAIPLPEPQRASLVETACKTGVVEVIKHLGALVSTTVRSGLS